MLLDYIKNDIKEGKLKLITKEVPFRKKWKQKEYIRVYHYLVGDNYEKRVSKKVVEEIEEICEKK